MSFAGVGVCPEADPIHITRNNTKASAARDRFIRYYARSGALRWNSFFRPYRGLFDLITRSHDFRQGLEYFATSAAKNMLLVH